MVGNLGSETTMGTACTHVAGAQRALTAPVAGRLVVRATVPISIEHDGGVDDILIVGIGLTPTDCAYGGEGRSRLAGAQPAGDYDTTLPTARSLDVVAGIHTFYLNGFVLSGCCDDVVLGQAVSLEATFYPN